MLIATLPPIHLEERLFEIFRCPLVGDVRYNTGAESPYSPIDTLLRLKRLADSCGKKLWPDLKGRQLRVAHWAAPEFAKIILNHPVQIKGRAKIYFRGGGCSNISVAKGRVIFVDPLPEEAPGRGQAVNIVGDDIKIFGYSIKKDIEYLKAAGDLGLTNIMLSFVEQWSDLEEVEKFYMDNPNVPTGTKIRKGLKIESQAGLDFVSALSGQQLQQANATLVVARDDLWYHIGNNKALMLAALKMIISKDPNAIVASRIFSGLEGKGVTPSMADFSDLEMLRRMGYKNFMLSDGICRSHFSAAIQAWRDFKESVCLDQ